MPKQLKFNFGKDWTNGEINFPAHFTPEIIHSALYIWNAGEDSEEGTKRINFLHDNLGAKKMAFIMSILVLPDLIELIIDKGITIQDVINKTKNQTKH